MKRINKVAVLGAGTMGARIAAHFANAGVPSFCSISFLRTPTAPRVTKSPPPGSMAPGSRNPPPFSSHRWRTLVTVGNFDDDLKHLADVRLDHRGRCRESRNQAVAAQESGSHPQARNDRDHQHQRLARGTSPKAFRDDFRRSWFGTHFFNPPRYMRLMEIIPTPDADPALIDAVAHFCDVRLGKGVVIAKDTPNFIGNRIGTFSVLNVIRLMQEMDLTIEEIDALTGQAVGWPRSATFRTIDLVGLDILGHVVSNMTQNVHDERSELQIPHFFRQMLERKWLGDKTKGGFYKKVKAQTERKTSAWHSTGRRWNIIRGRSRNSPRSRWRKTSKRPARASACCSASTAASAEARQGRALSCGRRSPNCGLTPPIAFPKFPTPSSRSIAPCAWASTGNSARSNSGTPPAWKPRWRA